MQELENKVPFVGTKCVYLYCTCLKCQTSQKAHLWWLVCDTIFTDTT